MLTIEQLAAIAGRPANDNMRSVIEGLNTPHAATAGLTLPHRLAPYTAQTAHESGGFKYDRELWGPTAAQERYEGRLDLGNTMPGDGYRYSGRCGIQITGRSNYARFTAWAKLQDPTAPDFVVNPDAVLTDPWEGLGPIWYWQSRAGIAEACDRGDFEAVTRLVNGGLNGLEDRRRYYVRAALVLLGRDATDVRGFQRAAGLTADGIAGPLTRAALHRALRAAPPLAAATQVAPAPPASTIVAPPPSELAQDRAGLAGLWAWIWTIVRRGGQA